MTWTDQDNDRAEKEAAGLEKVLAQLRSLPLLGNYTLALETDKRQAILVTLGGCPETARIEFHYPHGWGRSTCDGISIRCDGRYSKPTVATLNRRYKYDFDRGELPISSLTKLIKALTEHMSYLRDITRELAEVRDSRQMLAERLRDVLIESGEKCEITEGGYLRKIELHVAGLYFHMREGEAYCDLIRITPDTAVSVIRAWRKLQAAMGVSDQR